MSLINIRNLSFGYSGSVDAIFKNVSLQIDTDWKLGLLGRNGKGKTTLLKLFMGKFEFLGKIDAAVKFEYFPYEVKNKSLETSQIILEINPQREEWAIKKELALLNVDSEVLTRAFSSLSSGEQTKVLLAILFSKENVFLLIDEPTNHLDLAGREILGRYLKGKNAYIIVSHDRAFLDSTVDHILSINKANIEIQKGNCSSYLNNKRLQDEFEQAEDERLQTEISRLKVASRQANDWSNKLEATKIGGGKNKSGLKPDRGAIGAKSAKMMKKSKVIESHFERSIEEKTKLLKNVDKSEALGLNCIPYFSERLLVARDLCVKYDDKIVNAPITFEINRGDRIALIGKNGSGKSSILKAIIGECKSYLGDLSVGSRLIISYVSQNTTHISGTIEMFCSEFHVDKTKLLSMLFKLGFERVQFEKRIEDYSEGQKKKLLIAKSLAEEANLYIWDEPLNYVDIISRQQIEDLILQSKPTMIFVEHDKFFCESVQTKVVEI